MAGGGDRISNLPGNVVDDILKHLPLPEAVRTSALSKAWRYNWKTIPRLDFSFYQLLCLCHSKCKQSYPRHVQFFPWICRCGTKCNPEQIVSHVLFLHQGVILKFSLEGFHVDNYHVVNHWLQFLSNHPIEDFELELTPKSQYELPCLVFSFNLLRRLSLGFVDIKLPPAFQDFCMLVKLSLFYVSISPVELQGFISKCPMLEVLSVIMGDHVTLYCLDINTPNLKELCLKGLFGSISLKTPSLEDLDIEYGDGELLDDFANGVIELPESNGDESNLIKIFGHMPSLRKFKGELLICKFLAIGGVPDELPSQLHNMTHLQLRRINFGLFNNVKCVLSLIKSSPNLESLDLDFETDNWFIWPTNVMSEERVYEQNKILNCLKAVRKNGIILGHLSIVDISGCCVFKSEQEFVKLLLLTVAGNMVQKFRVNFNGIRDACPKKFVNELKRFHRKFSERVPLEIRPCD